MEKPDIHRLLQLQELLIQFEHIMRVVQIPPAFRQENDTEHSYNLAMTAWFLSAYFPELDRDKVIRFALAHDLVEIHAGDTYIYANQATLDSKAEREAAALKRLDEEWADFPDMIHAIHEYEQRKSSEAKFVYALDKIMPVMTIFLGKGHTWQEEGITRTQLQAHKRDKVAVSPEINEYWERLHDLLVEHEHYFPKPSPTK